ncbi:ABC transporter substrate-binding protein [Actinoplanes utahensis]|uniref:ABC transporter substrate-binding protein n=1 Tax=Actinoplanes utahensis TaxID=1869 RepID=UPI00069131D1|nr:extracellular solute-binding protein [Actinoplanes utahensis]GIF35443.1 ABC transporter substrate-binding protein [Actinoplanes utahensis]
MQTFGRRALGVTAAGLAAALAISGCSGEKLAGNGGDSGGGEGQITLKVNYFGDMGQQMLKERFEKANPNIKITLNSAEFNAHHEDLQKKLVAGSGAADVVAVDEGFMVKFKAQGDQFVNLLDHGLGSAESRYLPWKWKNSLTADGKQIGMGTDVGGLAMCYRTDLFKAAGLPTDRDQVSALWPTWDKFIATGQTYTKASGKKFIDSGTNLFNPVLGQQPVGFYDEKDQLQMEGGPKVAFDVSMKAIEAGISANLVSFQPGWNQGFNADKFAVLACPAWMLGHIQQTAPGTKGKWDIAAIPGGGGNWGGSWWTIPAQTKNAAAAAKFIEFATAPEQQIEVFKTVGNLPSQPALYKDQAVLDFKHPFMSNAPTGQIFAKTAESLKPQYLGVKHGKTREDVEKVITQVGEGKVKPGEAWPKAVEAAQKVASS